ncbi:hypothetical protein [Microbacterium sp. No. 7]|uniref:hypothetical protein n=1 Tax=Microbacterium sp. No. 7 TaxID=1714373 RepID=UPI0006D211F3|nr:hypothetical protein [Microbacterium sp. No. 7]ALJ19554.1 hypothetical protein AOA12_06375 [Microbacterium sp. No. 7]
MTIRESIERRLSEIGAIRKQWDSDREYTLWVNAPLEIVLDEVARTIRRGVQGAENSPQNSDEREALGEPAEAEEARVRILAKLDRIPDSDAVMLDKADVRAALQQAADHAARIENELEPPDGY